MNGQVLELCRKVWQARQAGRLTRDETLLAQQLYVAAAADIVEQVEVRYDPECDRRVLWLREVIRELRTGEKVDGVLDALVGWLMGERAEAARNCGKNLAGGADS